MKRFIAFNILGIGLLLAGIVSLVTIMRSHAVNTVVVPTQSAVATLASQPTAEPQVETGYIGGEPAKIAIPSLDIDLPVIPGHYDAASQTWTLTNSKVQFATMTTQPNNQAGNTFMYGHARTNVFGKLPKIESGAVAIVTTTNDRKFYYTLSSTRVVEPTESDVVLDYAGKPVLTLQTCVGLWYQHRMLLTFNLERVV